MDDAGEDKKAFLKEEDVNYKKTIRYLHQSRGRTTRRKTRMRWGLSCEQGADGGAGRVRQRWGAQGSLKPKEEEINERRSMIIKT